MIEDIQVFGKKWFKRHQRKLLWLLNTPIIKTWFRYVMRIHSFDCPKNETINKITPSSFSFGAKIKDGKIEVKTDFRTHDKYAKRLYYAFKPMWFLMHGLDWAFLDRMNALSKLSFGFSTLTVYPDNGTTTIDGCVYREFVNETFSTIRAGAGVATIQAHNYANAIFLVASTTNNQYSGLRRVIATFDTSDLTSGATISNAVMSCYGKNVDGFFWAERNNLGSPVFHIAGATPASNDTLVAADYSQCQTTSFGTVANASWSESAYNDVTLNESGISNISKTGISKFSFQLSWDILNNTTGLTWGSSKTSGFAFWNSSEAGTTKDPKLVVTYSIPVADTGNFFQMF